MTYGWQYMKHQESIWAKFWVTWFTHKPESIKFGLQEIDSGENSQKIIIQKEKVKFINYIFHLRYYLRGMKDFICDGRRFLDSLLTSK